MKYIFAPLALMNVMFFVMTLWKGVFYHRITHFKWGLATTIFTLFVHSLAIIYFILVFRAIKEALDQDKTRETDLLDQGKNYLKKTCMLATGGMLIAILTAISGGAVDAAMLSGWGHVAMVFMNVFVNTYLFWLIYLEISQSAGFVRKVDEYLIARDHEQE